jgi:flagellar biosynthesis chaperone FliJ
MKPHPNSFSSDVDVGLKMAAAAQGQAEQTAASIVQHVQGLGQDLHQLNQQQALAQPAWVGQLLAGMAGLQAQVNQLQGQVGQLQGQMGQLQGQIQDIQAKVRKPSLCPSAS